MRVLGNLEEAIPRQILYRQRVASRNGRSTAETLAEITVPTLILKADAPPETRKTSEEVAKSLKNGKLVHIDDSGHNLHHDQRQRTVEALRPFLGSL